jgi:hypothetical protein
MEESSRTPPETPVDKSSPERSQRRPSFLKGYLEKLHAGSLGGPEKDSENPKEEKKETKKSRLRDGLSRVLKNFLPQPEPIASPGEQERPFFNWQEDFSSMTPHRERPKEIINDVPPVKKPTSGIENAGEMTTTDIKESITTTAYSVDADKPSQETGESPEFSAIREPVIPPVESLQEIFARQSGAEQVDSLTPRGAEEAIRQPERWFTGSQTIFERQIIHTRERSKSSPKISPNTISNAPAPRVESRESVSREVTRVKEVLIIDHSRDHEKEIKRTMDTKILKENVIETRPVDKRHEQEPVSIKQLDKVIQKRLEEDNRKAVEAVMEKTIEAAKKNVSIESLYEKRHERIGTINNSQSGGGYTDVSKKLFEQQVEEKTTLMNDLQQATKKSGPDPTAKLPTMYKQAAATGFWVALLVIIIFAFAVILIR